MAHSFCKFSATSSKCNFNENIILYLVQRPVGPSEPKLALFEGVRPQLGGPADVGKVGAPEAGDVAVLEPRRVRTEEADRQHLKPSIQFINS